MSTRYQRAYIQGCQDIITTFQGHLQRALTSQEQRWCENIGTLRMLESMGREMTTRATAAELEQELQAMASWTEARFHETLEGFLSRLVLLLQRDLTTREHQRLEQQGTISRWLQLDEQLAQVPADEQRAYVEEWLAAWKGMEDQPD